MFKSAILSENFTDLIKNLLPSTFQKRPKKFYCSIYIKKNFSTGSSDQTKNPKSVGHFISSKKNKNFY
mgnify:CR=1 FL=1